MAAGRNRMRCDMLILALAVTTAFLMRKSEFRWKIIAIFSFIILMIVLLNIAVWWNLISIPMSIITGEIAIWSEIP